MQNISKIHWCFIVPLKAFSCNNEGLLFLRHCLGFDYLRYMNVWRHFAVSAVLLISTTLPAQERPLEELSNATLDAITTSFDIPDSLYISLEEYHMLIERQPLSSSDRSNFKQEVNDFYSTQHDEFYEGLTELQRVYVSEINQGASIELDSIWTQAMEGTRNIYEVRMQVSFHYPDEETTTTFLETMVGTVRRRYSFLSPIVESYD